MITINQIITDIRSMDEFLTDLRALCKKIWLRPEQIEGEVWKLINNDLTCKKIIISGETKNLSIYLILLDDRVLALTPEMDLRENILLKRWNDSWYLEIPEPLHYFVFDTDQDLISELDMPNFILINLCVIENFPIPRLNLSIGTCAAYLRKQQVAQVHIIDMQMGHTEDFIVQKCMETNPDLIGMSVNFGQKHIAFSLLDKLFDPNNKLTSLIATGNVIPSFSPEQFLERYPSIVIGEKEGEYTLHDLALHLRGRLSLNQVRGLAFIDKDKGIQHTLSETFNMAEMCTPALDTIDEVALYRGALTLEGSRGCDYSKCTFCPRDHKLSSWRPLSAAQTLEQIDNLLYAGDNFGIKPHIFFADEEFIGELPNGGESQRVIDICKGLILKPNKMRLDLAARADSVYESKKSFDWNVERLEMWHYLKRAGTDRVFIGVESGSEKQLKRYGKGTTPEQNIVALRILSALGIDLRIGFIMFDQAMHGLDDLRANMEFLERTDAIMKPIDIGDMSYRELYDKLLNDQEFIDKHKSGKPVYSIVSYMLASMEVLMNAPYARLMQVIEKKENVSLIQNSGKPDTNMGRYAIGFADPVIGDLSEAAQKWIDSNFGVMYTVKSLYKVANDIERKFLHQYMVKHRQISHFLLKYLVFGLDSNSFMDESLKSFLVSEGFFEELAAVRNTEEWFTLTERDKIYHCMTNWQQLMSHLVNNIRNDLADGIITDSDGKRLEDANTRWFNKLGQWELINSFDMAQ
jgi:hypothetical protein